MLDRRAVITGLAAFAVAGRAADLPIRPEPISIPYRTFPNTPRAFMLGSPWYFDHSPAGVIRVAHASGFQFYNDPRPDGRPVFSCVFGDAPSTVLSVRAFELAATFIARHGNLLRLERGHVGAIYLDYTQRDPRGPFEDVYTEDAPSEPHLDRFYQIRFPYPDPRGGWFDDDQG